MTAKQNELMTGVIAPSAPATHSGDTRLVARFLGFSAVALFPAMFWTGVLYAVAAWVGNPPSLLILGGFFTIILAFLSVIFASVIDSSERD